MQRNLIGSVSSGTMRTEDLIPVFVEVLESLDTSGSHIALIREANAVEDFDTEDASEIVSDLFDALNEYAPAYCYFGAHPGDGADYGFWLCEDWEQMAHDDGVFFCDDLSEADEAIKDRDVICVVNDHGNATLYGWTGDAPAQMTEVWSVV